MHRRTQRKIVWFILFLMGIFMAFFYFVKREQDKATMTELETKDYIQDGDVKSTLEVYRRLETKWIGTSKHVQTLKEDLLAQIDKYEAKMDSISDDFMRVNNSIENVKEHLSKKIDMVKEDLDVLNDLFKSYKRSTNRKIDDIMIRTLPRIEDDLKGINDSLDVILRLESIKKEIKKQKNN